MATGRIGVTPTLGVRWSKAPAGGTTSLSGLDDNSVSLVYSVGYEQVYRNGVLLSRGNDYTATNGTSITLIDATIAGDIIEVFAQQLVPLTDAISKGQFTAKGSLLSASAASTPGVLAVGSNNQVLTADSSTTTGLKWATPASGGMTLLQSLSLSGASTTSSSLSGSYKMLRCIYYEVTGTDTYNNMTMGLRVNSNSGNIYAFVGLDTYGTAGTFTGYNTSQIELNTIAYNANTKESSGIIEIPNYANGSSDAKTVTFAFAKQDDRIGFGSGRITLTDAITTLTFRYSQSGGSFTAGTVDIYGVN